MSNNSERQNQPAESRTEGGDRQRPNGMERFWSEIAREASRLGNQGASELANGLFHESNTFVLYGPGQDTRDAASGHGGFDVTAGSHGIHGQDGMENDHSRGGRDR